MYKLPATDHILAESSNYIYSICNKEELPQQWKESIIVPLYKKGGKTDGRSCRGM
jgi:hypothetical protein